MNARNCITFEIVAKTCTLHVGRFISSYLVNEIILIVEIFLITLPTRYCF